MDLKTHAESLSKDLRHQIIMDYKETDLHKFLKELFQSMEPNYMVEITHGTREFGKDLVIVKSDTFTQEVIGVVVKCGHIRGKTRGDVDDLICHVDSALSKTDEKVVAEIRSQVQQASKHPAEMKSKLEASPVSKVFVVLAGEFSNNARVRLTNELATKLKFLILFGWLINLQNFILRFFFTDKLLIFCKRKAVNLKIIIGEENQIRICLSTLLTP